MAKRFLFLVLWLALALPTQAAEFSDSFTRGDNEDVGANWDVQTGSSQCQIVGNELQSIAVDEPCGENVNSITVGTSQFAEVKLAAFTGSTYKIFGLMLRASSSAATYYRVLYESDSSWLVERVVTDTPTNISLSGSGTAPVAGDTIRATATGTSTTVIKIYLNDTEVATGTDDTTPITDAGRVGVRIYVQSGAGGAVTDVRFDDFRGGDGDGAPPVGGTKISPQVIVVE